MLATTCKECNAAVKKLHHIADFYAFANQAQSIPAIPSFVICAGLSASVAVPSTWSRPRLAIFSVRSGHEGTETTIQRLR